MSKPDATAELRDAIKTAFPQMTDAEVSGAIKRMRAANRRHGGA